MAQRRMTSLEVIDTDAFLDMPVSSQNLYFHLNARGDDDGFVANPKRIMKVVGAQEDDIKMLIAKKFIIAFEDGVCVIKHWRINNFIRKDIYKETNYLNHKQTLFIRQNGAYTLSDNGRALPVPDGHFKLEDVYVDEASTPRQPRIGKVSTGKVSVVKTKEKKAYRQSVLEHWNAQKVVVHKSLSKDAQKEIDKLFMAHYPLEDVKKHITLYATILHGKEYFWSYKWNLYEFLKRGLKKFEGKSIEDYKKSGPEKIVTKTDKF